MNKGVEILLARMRSHPEEFQIFDREVTGPVNWQTRTNKWDHICLLFLDEDNPKGAFLTDKEKQTLRDQYYLVQGESFTKHILKIITKAENKD